MEGQPQITGLILAGGAGRRVGGQDKGLIPWRGKPLVEHVIQAVQHQVDTLLISCNRNTEQYQGYGAQVVGDRSPDFQGPLAGMEAATPHVQTEFLLVVACDTPRLPTDLASRLLQPLLQANSKAAISFAHDGNRDQYLCAVLRSACLQGLAADMAQGQRAVHGWYAQHACAVVDFSDQPDAFQNYNSVAP